MGGGGRQKLKVLSFIKPHYNYLYDELLWF